MAGEIDCKARFIELLMSTKRKGMEDTIKSLEALGFFEAPASSKHHLAEVGGLVKHSLNVYTQAALIKEVQVGLKPEIESRLPEDSIIIASLLHDVCKADIYKGEVKRRKNDRGEWESYYGFKADYSHCPLGHGEKSVIRLLKMGLDLKSDEIAAIRWHMGAWDLAASYEANGNFSAACNKYPLLPILMVADQLATHVLEAPLNAS